MRRRQVKVVSVSMMAVLVACSGLGCGSSATTSGPTLTSDQFVQQADAICQADNSTIGSLAAQLGDSPTPEQQRQWITGSVIPLYTHTVSAIGALSPPRELASKVSTWLGAFKTELANGASNPTSMLDGSGGMPTVYNRARDLGLSQCSEAPKK